MVDEHPLSVGRRYNEKEFSNSQLKIQAVRIILGLSVDYRNKINY